MHVSYTELSSRPLIHVTKSLSGCCITNRECGSPSITMHALGTCRTNTFVAVWAYPLVQQRGFLRVIDVILLSLIPSIIFVLFFLAPSASLDVNQVQGFNTQALLSPPHHGTRLHFIYRDNTPAISSLVHSHGIAPTHAIIDSDLGHILYTSHRTPILT